jgi:hypothetical protein
MQQAQVDIPRDMVREPGFEFRGARELALAVDGGETVEGADEDYEVGYGEEQAGPEGFGDWRGEGGGGGVPGAVGAVVEGGVEG